MPTTDDDLSDPPLGRTQLDWLTDHPDCADPDDVRRMAAEIRRHRHDWSAAALSAEDVEALRFARASVLDDRDKVAEAGEMEIRWGGRFEKAIAVLDRLINGAPR